MSKLSFKGPLGILKGRSNIFTNKYIFQFSQVPYSFLQFPVLAGKTKIINSGSFHRRNALRAAHRIQNLTKATHSPISTSLTKHFEPKIL